MARHPKVSRICPGEYKVIYGDFVVSISRFDHLESKYGQWVVSAGWNMSIYSDPVLYLADAKSCAIDMINEAIEQGVRPPRHW